MTESPISLPSILHFEHVLPRERFIARASATPDPKKWPKTKVDVFDLNHSNVEPIYTYGRNYEMLSTFEPFRLFDGSNWHYYALISLRYTDLSVLDLESLEIVAERPAPAMTARQAELYNATAKRAGKEARHAAGDPNPGLGFCPREIHVPDVLDIYDDQSLVSPIGPSRITGRIEDGIADRVECVETFLNKRTFGLVAGCTWGDEWSTKIETFSLSGFLDTGKLEPGPKLGYFVKPEGVALSQCYGENFFLLDDWPWFELATPMSFKIEDGVNQESRLGGSEAHRFTLPQ